VQDHAIPPRTDEGVTASGEADPPTVVNRSQQQQHNPQPTEFATALAMPSTTSDRTTNKLRQQRRPSTGSAVDAPNAASAVAAILALSAGASISASPISPTQVLSHVSRSTYSVS
jgi:hypothetical protein